MTISEKERARLQVLYEKARYEVQPPQGTSPVQIEIGALHPQIDDHLRPRESWMFITAYEPMGQEHPPRRNRLAQQRLLHALEEKRKRYWMARGYDPRAEQSWEEPSVLVFGVSRSEALNWARRYRQLAILFGARGEKAQLLFAD